MSQGFLDQGLWKDPNRRPQTLFCALLKPVGPVPVSVIGKVKKGRSRCPFFALKKHRNEWREQHEGRRNLRTIDAGTLADSVADRPVANLIVVLDETQEAMLRQISYGAAMHPISMSGKDSVIDKGPFERLCKLSQGSEICVVTGKLFSGLARQKARGENRRSIAHPFPTRRIRAESRSADRSDRFRQ